jgi:hypothetical protein
MKQFSNFKIQIQNPDGSKQFVWEKTVEGDTLICKEMDAEVKRLEAQKIKIGYAKRAVFGSKALFNKLDV